MGVWGRGYYDNDDTCDIRDGYVALLEQCDTDEEAYEKLIERERDRMENEEDALVFWATLADTQWSIGRLRENVKEEAVTRISRCIDEKSSTQDELISLLSDELRAIRERLSQPMPKKKRISKLLTGNLDPWELNDVYAYQFHSKRTVETGCFGKYIAIQKIGSDSLTAAHGKPAMRVHIFDKLFDSIPTVEDVKGIRLLPLDLPDRHNISHDGINPYDPNRMIPKVPVEMNTLIAPWKRNAYPKKYLFYVGNAETTANHNTYRFLHDGLGWDDIERWLPFYLGLWKDLKYIDLGNGFFDYQRE